MEHWDVNNENLHGDWYEQALNDPDVTPQMFEDVNAIDSDVKLFLNEFGVLENNMAMVRYKMCKKCSICHCHTGMNQLLDNQKGSINQE